MEGMRGNASPRPKTDVVVCARNDPLIRLLIRTGNAKTFAVDQTSDGEMKLIAGIGLPMSLAVAAASEAWSGVRRAIVLRFATSS